MTERASFSLSASPRPKRRCGRAAASSAARKGATWFAAAVVMRSVTSFAAVAVVMKSAAWKAPTAASKDETCGDLRSAGLERVMEEKGKIGKKKNGDGTLSFLSM